MRYGRGEEYGSVRNGGCTIERITVTTMQRAGMYKQKAKKYKKKCWRLFK